MKEASSLGCLRSGAGILGLFAIKIITVIYDDQLSQMVVFGLFPFKLQCHKALLIGNIRLQGARWVLRQVLNCSDPLFLPIEWK